MRAARPFVACLLCFGWLVLPARPAAAAKGTQDIRRPLVPLEVPSREDYWSCYPETRSRRKPHKQTKIAVERFDLTGTDDWHVPLRLGNTTKALRRNPEDALAAEMLGVALTLFHEFPGAITAFEEAGRLADALFERVPDAAVAARCLGGAPGRIRVNLANTALLAGDRERARRSLEEVGDPSALHPLARLRFHWLRAELLAGEGDLDAALGELEAATSVELPDEGDLVYPQFVRPERREAAQQFFEGIVARRAGDLERAEEAYRAAAAGGFLDAAIGLANVRADQNRAAAAIGVLEGLEIDEPANARDMMKPEVVLYDLGNFLALDGQEAKAVTAYQQALQMVVERSCRFVKGARLYAERYCDARKACGALKAIPVENQCVHDLKCRDLTEEDEDGSWWGRALCDSLEPEIFVAAHNNLAMTLAELARNEQAVEKHLLLAAEGARGTAAELVPRANLVRTRWQRGDRAAARIALRELAAVDGGAEVAARTLWEQLDLRGEGTPDGVPEVDLDDLRGLETFAELAERSRAAGDGGFWSELAAAEALLRAGIEDGAFAPEATALAESVLASWPSPEPPAADEPD
jgi:tetratricopeptide (TPR) repeat protein